MQNIDTAMSATALEGGFHNPVFDSQKVFDSIMNAMARPGTIAQLPELASAPEPVLDNAAAIIATLCDADTHLWLDETLANNAALCEWVTFQTAAPLTRQKSDAQFALLTDAVVPLDFSQFGQGSQEYPDRSTTVIIQVVNITQGEEFNLSGPGIKATTGLNIEGLPENFLTQWHQNNALFPRGVDVILVSEKSVVCLPRTTRISQGSA